VEAELRTLFCRCALLALLAVACARQEVKSDPPQNVGYRLLEGETLLQNLLAREPPPPADDSPLAVPAKQSPATIQRAGRKALDPAAHGSALAWPTLGVLISGFGERDRDRHDGIDLAAPEGTPVRAAEQGTVLFAGEQRGYGKLVLLAHGGDLVTVYAHNAKNLVKKGERVSRGEQIARVGHTGNATGPHLHFEVRVGARARDPLGFLH
jgi:lipoprotein NlpD